MLGVSKAGRDGARTVVAGGGVGWVRSRDETVATSGEVFGSRVFFN